MTSKSNYRILFATNISSLSNCLSLFLILLFDSNPQRIWKKELGRKWFLHLASSFRTSLCCCLGMPILFLLTKWNSSWLGGITRPRWRCCDCKMTCHFLLGHFGTFYFEKSVTFFVSNPDADDLNKFEINWNEAFWLVKRLGASNLIVLFQQWCTPYLSSNLTSIKHNYLF